MNEIKEVEQNAVRAMVKKLRKYRGDFNARKIKKNLMASFSGLSGGGDTFASIVPAELYVGGDPKDAKCFENISWAFRGTEKLAEFILRIQRMQKKDASEEKQIEQALVGVLRDRLPEEGESLYTGLGATPSFNRDESKDREWFVAVLRGRKVFYTCAREMMCSQPDLGNESENQNAINFCSEQEKQTEQLSDTIKELEKKEQEYSDKFCVNDEWRKAEAEGDRKWLEGFKGEVDQLFDELVSAGCDEESVRIEQDRWYKYWTYRVPKELRDVPNSRKAARKYAEAQKLQKRAETAGTGEKENLYESAKWVCQSAEQWDPKNAETYQKTLEKIEGALAILQEARLEREKAIKARQQKKSADAETSYALGNDIVAEITEKMPVSEQSEKYEQALKHFDAALAGCSNYSAEKKYKLVVGGTAYQLAEIYNKSGEYRKVLAVLTEKRLDCVGDLDDIERIFAAGALVEKAQEKLENAAIEETEGEGPPRPGGVK